MSDLLLRSKEFLLLGSSLLHLWSRLQLLSLRCIIPLLLLKPLQSLPLLLSIRDLRCACRRLLQSLLLRQILLILLRISLLLL